MLKFLVTSVISFLSFSNALAANLDCEGAYINGTGVYISTNPTPPYDRFVRQSCGGMYVPLNSDLYIVIEPGQRRVWGACAAEGSMFELKAMQKKETDQFLEMDLAFNCSKLHTSCSVSRKFKVDKSTGAATYFNLHESQQIAIASLSCKIN